VRVIDPAPAVARQVERLLDAGGLCHIARESAPLTYYSSGAADLFEALLPVLTGEDGHVEEVSWKVEGYRLQVL
jgi:hypothetical protein